MRPRPALALTAPAVAGSGLPAVAHAAEIHVSRACFADPADRPETVSVRGSGFAPDATYRVVLDGKPLKSGSGRTDRDGRMSGRFVAPSVGSVSRVARQHKFDLRVEQGGLQPAASDGPGSAACSPSPRCAAAGACSSIPSGRSSSPRRSSPPPDRRHRARGAAVCWRVDPPG